MADIIQKNSRFLICLLLVLLTIGTFWQVMGHDFVNYDDGPYVTENHNVLAGLTLPGLEWAFTTSHGANWHPLPWLSHMLDCQLFGLKPAGHHLVSLFFHIVNTLLLFLILHPMTKATWQSAFVAVVAFFVLGLMSKPMLVTLPFALLLLDYWPLGRWQPVKPVTAVPGPGQNYPRRKKGKDVTLLGIMPHFQ